METEKPHLKYAIIVGLAFSITLTLIILRKFIFEPGLVESGDVYFQYKLDQSPSYVWNSFLSSTHIPYHHIIFSWLTPLMEVVASVRVISASMETLQRLLWSLCFILISFGSFIAVFKYTRKYFTRLIPCYAAAILGSLIYTVNPHVVGIVQWWPNLLSYSFLPLFLIFIPVALEKHSLRETLKMGLVPTLLLALNFCSPGAALNTSLFIFFLIVIELSFRIRKDFVRFFLRCSILFIEIVGLAILLNSYSIFPFVLVQEEFAWGGQNIPLQVGGLYGEGGANIELLDAFRLWKWSVTEAFALNTRSLLTMVVPVIAIFAMIVFNTKLVASRHLNSFTKIDKKTMTTLTLLIGLALFLAKGINDPFGDVYIWLVFSSPFSWLLEHSEIWIRYLSLAYAFLCAFLLAQFVERIYRPVSNRKYLFTVFKEKYLVPAPIHQYVSKMWKAKAAIILTVILVFSIVVRTEDIQAYPSGLFLGTANNLLRPSTLPAPYYDVNEWFSRQNGEFRIIWLPISSSLEWWRPSGAPPHPIGDWASSRPIATTNHPSQKDFMGFTLSHQENDDTFADLLGIFSVEYIIFHDDTKGNNIYPVLEDNPALTQQYNNEFIYAFQNEYFQPYIRALGKNVLSVGNTRLLEFASTIPTFNTSKLSIVFSEQLPRLGIDTLQQLMSEDLILFYNKPFIDLVFNSLSDDHIYVLSNYMGLNTEWSLENRRDLMNYEFDYGKGYVYSLEKRPFSFEIEVNESNQYEVWGRVLGSQTFTVLIDEYTNTQPSSPLDPNGFTWVKLGETHITEGKHDLTLINENGWGNLNLLVIISSDELEETRQEIVDHLSQSDVRIIDVFDETVIRWRKAYPPRFQEPITDLVIGEPHWPFYGNWTIEEKDGNKMLSQLNDTIQNTWIKVGENQTVEDGFFEIDIQLASRSTEPLNPIAITLIREESDYHSYIFSYTAQNEKLNIWKSNGGNLLKLGEADFLMEKDRWYTWRLEFHGSRISLYLNNIRYIDAIDNLPPYVYSKGEMYLGTSTAKVNFDNIKYYTPLQIVDLEVPKESDYILAARICADISPLPVSLHINGEEYSLQKSNPSYESDWVYTRPIKLAQGQYEIDFLPQSGIEIDQLIIFSLRDDEVSMTVDEIFLEEAMNPSLEYEKLEAEKWKVKVNSTEPFILAFSETYHSLWRAYTEDWNYPHFPLDSQINGFLINKIGNFEISIEFIMGEAHYYGGVISTLTLLFISMSYILLEDKSRRKLIQVFKKIATELQTI
jgi:hypothetical protein